MSANKHKTNQFSFISQAEARERLRDREKAVLKNVNGFCVLQLKGGSYYVIDNTSKRALYFHETAFDRIDIKGFTPPNWL